jgi:hypothetical protein
MHVINTGLQRRTQEFLEAWAHRKATNFFSDKNKSNFNKFFKILFPLKFLWFTVCQCFFRPERSPYNGPSLLKNKTTKIPSVDRYI